MLIKNIDKEYKIEYEEVRKKGVYMPCYIPLIKVYKDEQLILSSEDKEEEEFLNYLNFLVPTEIYNKIKEIYENCGYTVDEKLLRDVFQECDL